MNKNLKVYGTLGAASGTVLVGVGSALAIGLRTVLLVIALLLLVRKTWPGELLKTPLAQLTLGGLLWAFLSVAIGLAIGAMLVGWMISLPQKEKRSTEWAERWVGTALVLAIVVVFPFVYEGTQRHNAILDALSVWVLTTMGWLIS